jgi:hypothetical protein
MALPFVNEMCHPFLAAGITCALGNLVSYSIHATGANDITAGIFFVPEHNTRLVIERVNVRWLTA